MKLHNYFRNKKVLITGNTGFKGSWLSLWLIRMQATVYGISDRVPTDPAMFEELNLQEKINHRFCDIRDYQLLQEAILEIRPDYIFHLAAQPIVSEAYADPLTTLSTNIMGTAHVLEALKKLTNDCVAVFITSDKCYENVEQIWGYRETDPLGGKDIYSGSKGSAEIVIHSYFHSFFREKKPNIRLASARAGNVIGGGDFSPNRIVPDCMRAWSVNKEVAIRNPYSTRPWQHVLEPLSGYLCLAASLREDDHLNGESFNFGPDTGQNSTVLDILDELARNWGFDPPEEAYHYSPATHFNEAGLLKLNCDKAHALLHWKAILPVSPMIRYVGQWYQQFYGKQQNMFSFSLAQIEEYERRAQQQGLWWAAEE